MAQVAKNLLQCRRLGFDPWIRKIPWRREWQPTPVFLPGRFHGQRAQKCGGLCSRQVEYCPYNQTCFMQNEKKESCVSHSFCLPAWNKRTGLGSIQGVRPLEKYHKAPLFLVSNLAIGQNFAKKQGNLLITDNLLAVEYILWGTETGKWSPAACVQIYLSKKKKKKSPSHQKKIWRANNNIQSKQEI